MKTGLCHGAFLAFLGIVVALLCTNVCVAGLQQDAVPPWAGVMQALDAKGTVLPDGVFMVTLPRDDIQVSIGNVTLARPMALDSWVAFMDMGEQGSMVMGDVALQPQELFTVQDSLRRSGLDITAIHNTLVGETPQVYDLHFGGKGDPVKMAGVIRNALDSAKVPYRATTVEKSGAPKYSTDAASIDGIIGVEGTYEDGVFHYSLPREETITENGMVIPGSMDVATSIKFQPLPDNNVAVAGEYVLLADEVQPVIGALNGNGIMVTATHTHMLTEEPRLFYLHIWATGDPAGLAKGIREAIDQTNVKTGQQTAPVKNV